jgi:hypothetical protein
MKVVKILLVVAIVGLLAYLLLPELAGPIYISRRFTPREGGATIEKLELSFGVKLKTREIAVQGVGYTLAEGPLVTWAVPSGPPMYVFDSQGHLLDYTLDVGDDPRFRDKWIHGTNSNHALQPTATR